MDHGDDYYNDKLVERLKKQIKEQQEKIMKLEKELALWKQNTWHVCQNCGTFNNNK